MYMYVSLDTLHS